MSTSSTGTANGFRPAEKIGYRGQFSSKSNHGHSTPSQSTLLYVSVILVVLAVSLLMVADVHGEDQDALSVNSGLLKLPGGTEKSVGPGTYIPSPSDKELAKKMIEKDSLIERLRVQLDASENRGRELSSVFEDENRDLRQQLEDTRSWWNVWGAELVVGIVSAAVAGFITYEVMK